MDEVENPKFEELCRLCAVKTPMDLAMNIYENEGTIRQISKKICTCLPIQVDEMDELPKIICENCLYKLELCYDFRESSAQAGKLLIEIYKKLNSTRVQNDPIDHNELMIVQPRQLLNDGDLDLEEGNLNAMQQRQLLGPFNFQYANMEDENSGNDIPLISNEIKCDQQQNKKYDLQNIMDYAETETEDNNVSVDPQLNKIQLDKEINQEMETHEGSDSEHSLFVDEQLYNVSVPRFKIEKIESLAHFYKCTICLAVFTDADVLYSHRKEAHGSCVDDPKIRCDLQQNDLHDIIEHAETRIEENNSFSVDTQLNKIQLNNDCNKEINPKMDAFKNKDSNNTHSIFVNEQLYNTSMPNLIPDEQVIGIKIEKVESYEHSSNTNDSVCSNISGGSYEQKPQLHHEKYFHKCTICLALFTEEDVLRLHKEEAHGACLDNPKADDSIPEKSDKQITSEQVQKFFLENLGEYKENGEKRKGNRKKDFCFFCKSYVLNFARHILRKHSTEKEVQKISSLSPKSKIRRELLSKLNKKGNFLIRKPVRHLGTKVYILPCTNCRGYYSAKGLWYHRKSCVGKSDKLHQVKAQELLLKDFRVDKQLKNKVFPKMRPDNVSMRAKTDELICEFGALYFKNQRERYPVNVTSHKMRELAKLLIEIEKLKPSVKNLFEALKPEHFEILVSATKIVAHYNEENEFSKSASTALNLGTAIKECCRIAIVFLKKKQVHSELSVVESEADLRTLIQLIDTEWCFKISTRALNHFNMKQFNEDNTVSLMDNLKIIKKYLILKATTAVNQLQINCEDKSAYITLLETVFCRVLLLNRRQPRELQRLHLNIYEQSEEQPKDYEEFSNIITTSEKIWLQRFKRVLVHCKQGYKVPILFSPDIQEHMDVLLKCREKFVNKNNVYLFGSPSSAQSICGYKIIQKYATLSGVKNPQAIMALSDYDIDQLYTFMNETVNVHDGLYPLPADDISQTAKICMLLLLMEKREAALYESKNLNEVNINLDVNLHENNNNSSESKIQSLSENSKVVSVHSLPGTSRDSVDLKLQLPWYIYSSSFSLQTQSMRKNLKRLLVPWTDDQKKTVRQFFATHIKKSRPPKRHECLTLKNKYTTLFDNKDWLKIKVFVQNEYTKPKRWKTD